MELKRLNSEAMQELKTYDTIVVAGEEAASRRVLNQHKAFLKINDQYSIHYVINVLQQIEQIRDIYIIGPKDRLASIFEEQGMGLDAPKKIYLVEQKGNLYENVWHAFVASLPDDSHEGQPGISKYRDKAVLITPCDAPLMTVKEVEYFISRCDMDRYDYVLGLTPEKSMKYFYPDAGRPGIKMSYLHMKEKNYRINNLHMVKPVKVSNRDHINKMYAYRYQKKINNIFQLGLYVIRKDRFRSYRLLSGLQLALKCSELNLENLTRFFSKWAPKHSLEKAISRLLGTRFVSLEVPYPGAALDIDNDADFKSLQIMFDEWRHYLENMT
jgi:molybdopterin-guanine dinucleotide biosynthesis protein A